MEIDARALGPKPTPLQFNSGSATATTGLPGDSVTQPGKALEPVSKPGMPGAAKFLEPNTVRQPQRPVPLLRPRLRRAVFLKALCVVFQCDITGKERSAIASTATVETNLDSKDVSQN